MRSKGQDRRIFVDLGLHFGYVNRLFSLGNFDRMSDYNNSIVTTEHIISLCIHYSPLPHATASYKSFTIHGDTMNHRLLARLHRT